MLHQRQAALLALRLEEGPQVTESRWLLGVGKGNGFLPGSSRKERDLGDTLILAQLVSFQASELPSCKIVNWWFFKKKLFSGLNLQHVEFPGLGVKLELQPQQCHIQATLAIYTEAHSNTRSLTQ